MFMELMFRRKKGNFKSLNYFQLYMLSLFNKQVYIPLEINKCN